MSIIYKVIKILKHLQISWALEFPWKYWILAEIRCTPWKGRASFLQSRFAHAGTMSFGIFWRPSNTFSAVSCCRTTLIVINEEATKVVRPLIVIPNQYSVALTRHPASHRARGRGLNSGATLDADECDKVSSPMTSWRNIWVAVSYFVILGLSSCTQAPDACSIRAFKRRKPIAFGRTRFFWLPQVKQQRRQLCYAIVIRCFSWQMRQNYYWSLLLCLISTDRDAEVRRYDEVVLISQRGTILISFATFYFIWKVCIV